METDGPAARYEEFDEFYQGCYSRVVTLAAVLLGDQHEAQDVAQEAFARALGRWQRLRTFDVPEAWVRKVAFRLAAARGPVNAQALNAYIQIGTVVARGCLVEWFCSMSVSLDQHPHLPPTERR